MPDTVRIEMNEPGRLKWPLRCPRCGARDDLIWHGTEVVRNNRGPQDRSVRGASFLFYTQESIRFSMLMCRAHASTNQAGGALLGRDVYMIALRASIYASLLCLVVSLCILARSGLTGFAVFGALSLAWWAWCLYGVAGLFLLGWARSVAWVRPLRLDPDHDIAVMRFKDEQYARDFKRMNLKATTGAAASKTPT